MRLVSVDGSELELCPTGYQFPEARESRGLVNWDPSWDPNWLMIHGDVRTAGGDAWSFEDPCLTTWEAPILAVWLHDAAEGRVRPTPVADTEMDGVLTFLEPALGFSVASLTDSEVTLRAHLSAEALAGCPSAHPDPWDLYEFSVLLRLSRTDAKTAAQQWADAIAIYPRR